MKIRLPILVLTLALPFALLAKEEKPTASPTPKPPTILKRWMHALGMRTEHNGTTATGFKGLDIGLKIDPPQVNLPEVKQIKVTIRLVNLGKKLVQLEFPSSQRIEVLIKNKDGKTIEQWSEDQAFTDEPSTVTINPDERVEYAVSMATRDMVVGQAYTVEAFFPNYEQLRKTASVTPATPPPTTPKPKASPTPGVSPTPEPASGGRHKKNS